VDRSIPLGVSTLVLLPAEHPRIKVSLFVRQTRYNDNSWYGVQEGEHANSQHKLFEFIRFGATAFHQRPHPEERDESSEEENGAHGEEDTQGYQNKIPQSRHVPHAHRTNTT